MRREGDIDRHAGVQPESDLDALIEAEQRLGGLLEEARDRARLLVQRARDDAAEAERRLETELGEAAAELERVLLAKRAQAVAEVDRAFEADAERFRGVAPDEVERWADSVRESLIQGEPT